MFNQSPLPEGEKCLDKKMKLFLKCATLNKIKAAKNSYKAIIGVKCSEK
jgi:hypothetical protein